MILIWLKQRLPKLECEQTLCRHLTLIKASTASVLAPMFGQPPQASLIHFSNPYTEGCVCMHQGEQVLN